jgi:hypothetical protein
LSLYFVPLFIAILRKHKNIAGIAVLNIVLGWTLIGWVVALIWAVLAGQEEKKSEYEDGYGYGYGDKWSLGLANLRPPARRRELIRANRGNTGVSRTFYD